jgi:hypothetical protein
MKSLDKDWFEQYTCMKCFEDCGDATLLSQMEMVMQQMSNRWGKIVLGKHVSLYDKKRLAWDLFLQMKWFITWMIYPNSTHNHTVHKTLILVL